MEHHGDLAASDPAHIVHVDFQDVLILELNLAIDDSSRWVGDQSHHRQGANAFPAAAFANQPQCFPRFKFVGNAIHRLDHTFIGEEISS